MTAIIAGRTKSGNFIVTDAMASGTKKTRSYKDCKLDDKILPLQNPKCYCSLVGDATVLDGIQALDSWNDNLNASVDFSNPDVMRDALIATDKYWELLYKDGRAKPVNGFATVYFVSRQKVFEYVVTRKRDKYVIDNFRLFRRNEVVLNYASLTKKINHFEYPSERLYENAIRIIEDAHQWCKEGKEPYTLEYDFNNRFCGVVFSSVQNEREKLYSPFRTLSESIASEHLTPREFWNAIDNRRFRWSPTKE
ncbi:MAG TPA: hypothetical protein PLE74_04720 [Candidatus Cloacimonadota bacterium]|nr:hypothetical protein [Candidatus Cloacimonadota bacterium]